MSSPDPSPDGRTGEDGPAAEEARARDEGVTGRDAGPVDESDMAAADGLTTSPELGERYQDMLERGAAQTGEGAPRV